MRIPILDLTPEVKAHWDEFMDAAKGVLETTQFILGPNVGQFEKEIAAFLGVKHAIGCNSGTDALVIGLRALGVGPGDEVICPSFTFFATGETVSVIGAKPVFVDIDPKTYNMDVSKIEALITPRTKAVIPVHLYGNAVDMDGLRELASRRGLKILEDVAQAMGGEYQGRKVGTIGDVGAFSFFPSKNLGAFGDGGLITTNDDSLAENCRKLRTHGSIKKYYNEMIGYNSRLDELQAAFLRVKLKYLNESNEGRRQAASRYDEVFRHVPNIETPVEATHARHVYHQYTIRLTNGTRDKVHKDLAAAGIATMLYYPVPLHRLPVYAQQTHAPLPQTELACEQVISLPIWPTITPEIQIEVASAVRAAVESR